MHLTVHEPFTIKGSDKEPDNEFKKGDKIIDVDLIKEVLASEHRASVIKTAGDHED